MSRTLSFQGLPRRVKHGVYTSAEKDLKQEVSKGHAGEDAVASHLDLQVSLTFGELECICQSTEILLKHRLWVCRCGLGSVTLHFSEPYWSC